MLCSLSLSLCTLYLILLNTISKSAFICPRTIVCCRNSCVVASHRADESMLKFINISLVFSYLDNLKDMKKKNNLKLFPVL